MGRPTASNTLSTRPRSYSSHSRRTAASVLAWDGWPRIASSADTSASMASVGTRKDGSLMGAPSTCCSQTPMGSRTARSWVRTTQKATDWDSGSR